MQNKYMCETCATITCRGLLSRFGWADKYDDGKLSSKSLIYNRNWMSDIESPKLVLLYWSRLVRKTLGVFDFMRCCKDRLLPDKSNAFWLEHLSDFDRHCSCLTITRAIKVPREQNETSRWGQALQLLKIGCESLDDDTLYSHWSDAVITSTRCVACVYSNN